MHRLTRCFKSPFMTTTDRARPISLLPFISKLLEHLVHKRLTSYFTDNNLFNPFEVSGFHPQNFTESALIKLINNLFLNAKLNIYYSLLILLGLFTSFCTFNHPHLLNKLHPFGIQDFDFSWFSSYLSKCSFSVTYNSVFTSPLPLFVRFPTRLCPWSTSIFIYTSYLSHLISSYCVKVSAVC